MKASSGHDRRLTKFTIRGFLDRHLTAQTTAVVTILLLVASWIYPPWIIGSGRYVSHGWFFVFDTTSDTAMRVDFGRLFLIDGIILAAGALLAWAVFHDSTSRRVTIRLASYAVVLPVIAVAYLFATAVIGNIQRDVRERAAQPKRFDWSTGTLVEPKPASLHDALVTHLVRHWPVKVEVPGGGLVEFPAGMSSKEIAEVIKRNFQKPKFDPSAPFRDHPCRRTEPQILNLELGYLVIVRPAKCNRQRNRLRATPQPVTQCSDPRLR